MAPVHVKSAPVVIPFLPQTYHRSFLELLKASLRRRLLKEFIRTTIPLEAQQSQLDIVGGVMDQVGADQ